MQNRVYSTKSLVEAGLISALIVIIMMISAYTQLTDMAGFFILPIPVTILYVRHNLKITSVAIAVSAIIVSIFFNPITAVITAIIYGLIGVTFGYCIRRNFKVERTIIIIAASLIIACLLNICTYAVFIDKSGIIGLISKVINQFNYSIDMAVKVYGNNAQVQQNIKQLKAVFTLDNILKLLPGGLIVLCVIYAYINYQITKAVFSRLKLQKLESLSLTRIYLPLGVIVFVLLLLCSGLIMSKYKISAGDYIVPSVSYVFQMSLILQGMSLLAYYLRRKFRISKILLIVIFAYTFLSNFSIIFMYVGLIDLVIDFRKINPNRLVRK